MVSLRTLSQAGALALLALAAGCAAPPAGRPGSSALPPASSDSGNGVIEEFSDTTITRRVQAAIANEPTLQGTSIRVQTAQGKVQLSGVIASRADARTAIKLALGVRGVQGVSESLRVK